MNQILFFLASYLIFIAPLYALILTAKEGGKVKYRNLLLVTVTTFVTWLVLGYFLKNAVAHPRPDLTRAYFVPNDPYSFPSGHATFMFALFFSMFFYVKKGMNVLFILAMLTGIARVLLGIHYWYDVVGAFLLTYLFVYGIVRFLRKILILR